jgi:hypothetical protein
MRYEESSGATALRIHGSGDDLREPPVPGETEELLRRVALLSMAVATALSLMT